MHLYLCADFFDLLVLVFKFGTHIQRHVSQVTNHRVHLSQVFIHFRFSGVVCNPTRIHTFVCITLQYFVLLINSKLNSNLLHYVSTLWRNVRSLDHTLWLFVYYFAIFVSLPRTFILFERCRPKHNSVTQYIICLGKTGNKCFRREKTSGFEFVDNRFFPM